MIHTAYLQQRGVIRITGDDRLNFLQGIVTQDMRKVASDSLLYGCFLTPQGKYLVDFFVIEQGDGVLLDVATALIPDFIKRLTMFKLRSKVTIEDMSDTYRLYAFWGEGDMPDGALIDPRYVGMGTRLITDQKIDVSVQADYDLWQMQNGVPDVLDFERERTSMLEANMDLLHAVSWDKGCYMGQELTARTHYRGLVKKRLYPVRLTTQQDLEKDMPILLDGKTIGYIRRQHKDWAMAQVQIEHVSGDTNVITADQDATVIIPKWFAL